MKRTFNALAFGLFVVWATAASASEYTLDLLWGGTGDTISAHAGDTLTLEFYLSAPAPDVLISGYQFSILWDTDELSYVPGSFSNPGPSGGTGDWINGGGREYFLDQSAGELLGTISSSILVYPDSVDSLYLITYDQGPVYIGSLQFQVVKPISDGSTDVTACTNCGSQHVGDTVVRNDLSGAYLPTPFSGPPGTVNGAILNNPEPSTAALLGLGLVALAAARRRSA